MRIQQGSKDRVQAGDEAGVRPVRPLQHADGLRRHPLFHGAKDGHVRAAEGIDRLLGVSHEEADGPLTAQQVHQRRLAPIGVLELVNQQGADFLLPAVKHFRAAREEIQRQALEVVIVDSLLSVLQRFVGGSRMLKQCLERAEQGSQRLIASIQAQGEDPGPGAPRLAEACERGLGGMQSLRASPGRRTSALQVDAVESGERPTGGFQIITRAFESVEGVTSRLPVGHEAVPVAQRADAPQRPHG